MSNYFVFILRCWQDGPIIRFRLENPHTGEIHLFQSFEELGRFVAETLTKNEMLPRQNDGEKDHETE